MTNAAGGPPKKGKSGCVLAIVAVVVLLAVIGCCGGGGWWIYRLYERGRAAVVTTVEQIQANQRPVTLDGKLPESFPKDIPTFYGLNPVEGVSAPDGGGQQTFQGKADVDEVIGYYRQEMGKAGWDAHGGVAVGEGTMMKFTKDDRQAMIMVTGGTGRDVTVMIYYGKQEGASAETGAPAGEVATPPGTGGTEQPKEGGVAAERPGEVTREPTSGGNENGGEAVQLKATKLPSNFPTDVAVYQGMTVTFSLGNITEGKGSIIAEGKVDRGAVIEFYKQKFKDGGWTLTQNVEVAEMTLLTYEKDKRSVTVQVNPGDNGLSSLAISYEETK